jgi:glycosyltransferase involved in cell wall biosynthesis
MQQWVHGLGAFTVVASRGEVETLEKGGYDRVVRVGSGVDCEWFHPDHRDEALRRTWGVSPWHVAVLMGGRVERDGNLPLALEAVKGLQSRGVRVQAVVAGEGVFLEECRERWPWAVYTGGMDRRRLAVTAASCDLLALPGMVGTSGREVLEGMASGLPVVAFDFGAGREHVVHGVNGWVEIPGSDAGYARLLGRVVQMSEEQRLPVCRGARRTALGLTWEVVVGRFEAVLRRCAAGGRPEGAIPPTVPSPSAS